MKKVVSATVNIEILNGGFVLNYPVPVGDGEEIDAFNHQREVITSPRKLIQRIKEIVADLSTVAAD